MVCYGRRVGRTAPDWRVRMNPLTGVCAATYEGGHPAYPRRLTGGWLHVYAEALVYDRQPRGAAPLWTVVDTPI